MAKYKAITRGGGWQGMAVRRLKLLGGGAVRGSEGHPADDDDMASEKGHFFPQLSGRGAAAPCPSARYGPARAMETMW